ncbi:TPR repeat protein [Geomicrobium sp. JCM 19037]|uniref:hypothetical protein n=1 Tax=Geomicrobium sp. JCM 19037 TaxID=1460634 RepID=UPI00045F2AA7|nr:hypothetical protein [Geomicrobium sp. JCM 19037]GAK03170.1 TPR repeat protein [Geomicrobium sp. JCM 19037]
MNEEEQKVIVFPGTVQRLIENGLNDLKGGQFEKSLHTFQEVIQFEPDHQEAIYGKWVSLLKLERHNDVIQDAYEGLPRLGHLYRDGLMIVATALVEQSRWQELADLINDAADGNHIQLNDDLEFRALLEEANSHKEAPAIEMEEETRPVPTDLTRSLRFGSAEEQWSAFQQLKTYPLVVVIDTFDDVLQDKDRSPVVKSLILLHLKDEEMETPVFVTKNEKETTIVPKTLPALENYAGDAQTEIFSALAPIESDNPHLYETCRHVWDWMAVILYPFEYERVSSMDWAAASILKHLDM